MRTDDFVMLRRKRGLLTGDEESDVIEHRPIEDKTIASQKPNSWTKSKREAMKVADKSARKNVAVKAGKRNGKPHNWVRFLDMGISCPSDESDDELAFCKPSWTTKTGKSKSEQ